MSGCAPAGCTLPTEQQPLRLAEWDGLFARSLLGVARPRPTFVVLTLNAADGVEAAVRELAGRESSCCAFFTFAVTPAGESIVVEVEAPAEHVDALDWIEARTGPAAGSER